ncbi:MAG: diaminopimelate decarboxylase [Thermoprotei archaeon]|nr:MAG: diaminopimelate decarboxylase [Thermoprotei archaeon]
MQLTVYIKQYENILLDIAEEYGTPVYVYFAEILLNNFNKIKTIAKKYYRKILIAYAYKANSNIHLCKLLHREGAGAEVVSSGELFLALKASASKIVFDGVSKSVSEIEYAVRNRVWLINIENLGELKYIDYFSEKNNIVQKVGIRFNPGIEVSTHKHIATGGKLNKFGLDSKNFIRAVSISKKMKNIDLCAVHFHLGSQIFDTESYIKALERVLSLAEEAGLNIRIIDIGGGFGYSYETGETMNLDNLFAQISRVLKDSLGEEPTVVLEPGRAIVASAGILLTKVNYIKEVYGKKWVLVDAGMNDFIRPALYGAKHKITVLGKNGPTEKYSIGGPVCESADVFAEDMELPRVAPGDVLAVHDVGAYSYSMSSNYNTRPRPPEVLVDRKEIKLIRRRENFEDLLRLMIT